MPNFADQILGVTHQSAALNSNSPPAVAIDPGSDKSIYITMIANASSAPPTSRGLIISSGDNIKVYRGQTITYDPPLKLAKGATISTAWADMLIAYFITK